jgi:hypothetical protein
MRRICAGCNTWQDNCACLQDKNGNYEYYCSRPACLEALIKIQEKVQKEFRIKQGRLCNEVIYERNGAVILCEKPAVIDKDEQYTGKCLGHHPGPAEILHKTAYEAA